MNIRISEEAVLWYKDELLLKEGDQIRFIARYGGNSPLHQGFSLGFIVNEDPINIAVKKTLKGITFFIEDDDLWFFDDNDLVIDYNTDLHEPEYLYEKV